MCAALTGTVIDRAVVTYIIYTYTLPLSHWWSTSVRDYKKEVWSCSSTILKNTKYKYQPDCDSRKMNVCQTPFQWDLQFIQRGWLKHRLPSPLRSWDPLPLLSRPLILFLFSCITEEWKISGRQSHLPISPFLRNTQQKSAVTPKDSLYQKLPIRSQYFTEDQMCIWGRGPICDTI